MKKFVAAYSAIRLQDTPKGTGGHGTINEDACGVSAESITVADGMGGGGKTVSRERLEDLLTKDISGDARYLAETMRSHGEQISVSNMIAWGLVDYITEFQPGTPEETRGYIERVRSAVHELIPPKMSKMNVGSTLTYVNDEKDIIIGAGDSLAFTVYEGKAQFHNLDGFDSISMTVLKQQDEGFNPYVPEDWDKLRDHPHSNIVTNVVLLADKLPNGDRSEYELHIERLEIDRSVPSVTFVMSDGVAPDFVNPADIYHMAQSLFKGGVDRVDLDMLLRDIVKRAHDNTRGMWEYDASQKTDDATIVALYREPSKKEQVDALFDQDVDTTGEPIEGYLPGTVWTEDILGTPDDEITDPKVTQVDVEVDPMFDDWEQEFLGSDVSEEAIQDAARRVHQSSMDTYVNTPFNRFATWYSGLFDKVEEVVDAQILRLGETIHKYETMYNDWRHRDVETPVPPTEFMDDEANIEIDPAYAANENPTEPVEPVQWDDDVDVSDDYTGQAANAEAYEPQQSTLDSVLETVSGMYDSGIEKVSGAASSVGEWYTERRDKANKWYVDKTIELGDRYDAWSAQRASDKLQREEEKQKQRREKREAQQRAYEQATAQAQERREQVEKERELYKHMDTHRARARSAYWSSQRDLLREQAGSLWDRVTSSKARNIAAGVLAAGALAGAGMIAYENRDAIMNTSPAQSVAPKSVEYVTCDDARLGYMNASNPVDRLKLKEQINQLCE